MFRLSVGQAAKIAVLMALITIANTLPGDGMVIGKLKVGRVNLQQVIPTVPKLIVKLKAGRAMKIGGI